jgi:hypothetical protein
MWSFFALDYSEDQLRSLMWRKHNYEKPVHLSQFKEQFKRFATRVDEISETFEQQCPCEHRRLLYNFLRLNMNWLNWHYVHDFEAYDTERWSDDLRNQKFFQEDFQELAIKVVKLKNRVIDTPLKTAWKLDFDPDALWKGGSAIGPLWQAPAPTHSIAQASDQAQTPDQAQIADQAQTPDQTNP